MLLALALAAGLAAAIVVPHHVITGSLTRLTTLRHQGVFGWLLVAGVCALFALLGVVPGALIGLACGAALGIWSGFAAGAFGILLGAALAFWLSRSLARPMVVALLGRHAKLQALDTGISRDNWRLVALLRISPVMPFSLTSYALGLSGIGTRDYLIGNIGALPGLLAYVVVGGLGVSGLSAPGWIHTAIFILGAAASLALSIYVIRLLARNLRNN